MKKFYACLLILSGMMGVASAQNSSSYFFKYKTGVQLEDMSNADFIFGNNTDEAQSTPLSMFDFAFGGTSCNTFSVSEDGVVILGQSIYTPFGYDNYFTQSTAFYGQNPVYPILLPWAEDLTTGNDGSISYKFTGVSPSQKLVIEFKTRSAEDGIGPYNKTFQVWLYEGSNQIQYVYGDVASAWYNNANIGIAASAVDFMSVNSATNTVSTAVVASNSDGEHPNKPASLPVKGTSYLFSPTAIADDVPAPAPADPITTRVLLSPEFPVANQQKHTIYLGYGAQSVTLSASATGGRTSAAGYSYSWSPSTDLSNATSASPVASPKNTTTYTVTASDGNGHTATQSITVYVIDPRYGDKFYVCKMGKTSICISKEAVDNQLTTGATLGTCNVVQSAAYGMSAAVEIKQARIQTNTTVYPNPSAGVFNVQVPENMPQSTISVFSASGKMVAQKRTGEGQSSVQISLDNKLPGVYLIKVAGNGIIQNSKIIVQ